MRLAVSVKMKLRSVLSTASTREASTITALMLSRAPMLRLATTWLISTIRARGGTNLSRLATKEVIPTSISARRCSRR